MKKSALFFFLILITSAVFAQLNPVVVSIPMRDAKQLAADLYLPNSDSTPRPTVLIQTPYNKNFYHGLGLPLQVGFSINTSPYNFVIVDWRCFYGSSAACTTSISRGQDGYDCVEWIAAQSWSDGSVGTWGPSALGIVQFQTAKEHPPHLTSCVPIVAGMRTDYERYYPGGVYRTEYVQMLDILGYGLSTILLAHPVHDIYWTVAENATFYPSSIDVPMFMIGGWYDHATEEVLESFEGIRTQSNVAVRSKHKLLMGPWTHNTTSSAPLNIGELSYPLAVNVSDSLARKFMDYYLLNASNGWDARPVVEYFQMGEDTWNTDTSWNNSGLMNYNLFLHSSGDLNLTPPAVAVSSQTVTYDPHSPSPTVGGPTLLISLDQGPYDQFPVVESRSDVLIFSTLPLVQDVVMRGRPTAHLKVTSDRFDTDFSIRLTDVYPDGRSMLVLDGIRRMRFRNGYNASDTSNISPGTVYSLDVELFSNTAITFRQGHKIRIDISSANYPRFDCNLNNGQTMYAAGDTLIAQNTVYMNNTNASYITMPLESFSDAVDELQDGEAISVFPNPATDQLMVRGTVRSSAPVRFRITDLLGNEVDVCKTSSINSELSVANLSPGIYFLHIEIAHKVFLRKIAVAR